MAKRVGHYIYIQFIIKGGSRRWGKKHKVLLMMMMMMAAAAAATTSAATTVNKHEPIYGHLSATHMILIVFTLQ